MESQEMVRGGTDKSVADSYKYVFFCGGPDLVFTSVLTPHTWTNATRTTPEEAYECRAEFFEKTNEIFVESMDKNLHVGCGDMNVRLHGRLEGEDNI